MLARPDDMTDEEPTGNSRSLADRRGFLKIAAFAGAGLFLSSFETASALVGPSPAEISKRLGIPVNWIEEMGRPLVDYSIYIYRLKLRSMTVSQVIEPHTRTKGGVKNQIPPRVLWPNITRTLRVVDRLSAYLGERVGEVTSAYRSPAYNARCPGSASNSMHMRNMALDLKYKVASPYHVARVARAMRLKGMFEGGIGSYPSFTHIDTRGENVDW